MAATDRTDKPWITFTAIVAVVGVALIEALANVDLGFWPYIALGGLGGADLGGLVRRSHAPAGAPSAAAGKTAA